MGVDSDGKLFPISALIESSTAEERESGSEANGDAEEGEKNWKMSLDWFYCCEYSISTV